MVSAAVAEQADIVRDNRAKHVRVVCIRVPRDARGDVYCPPRRLAGLHRRIAWPGSKPHYLGFQLDARDLPRRRDVRHARKLPGSPSPRNGTAVGFVDGTGQRPLEARWGRGYAAAPASKRSKPFETVRNRSKRQTTTVVTPAYLGALAFMTGALAFMAVNVAFMTD